MEADQVQADFNEAATVFEDPVHRDNIPIQYASTSDDIVYFGPDRGQGWANYDQINDDGWTAPAEINADQGFSGDGGNYGGGGVDYGGGADYGGGGYDGGGDAGGGGGDGGGGGGGGD